MLGKTEGRRKGATEDQIVGWHHGLNEHEFEQALGDGDGQGSLVCCNPWSRKESDVTEQPKNTTKENLYSTRNSTQYAVMTYMGRESKSGDTCMCN